MKITHISANIAVLALMASLADPAFAQVNRTPWQMHAGEGVTKLDVTLPSNGALPENDYIAFNWARIPGEKDGWRPAPNGETIAFGGPKASRIGEAGGACRKAVDYTYFQTIVDVPAGTQVDEFKIVFEGMDDASRITLFNSEYRNGKVVEGSYVTKASLGTSTATTDLRSLLRPGKNRVVITQVDWCPVGNQLQSAQVQLNGSRVAAAMPTELGPFIPVSHGDVHIRSTDGLTYDFQAAGDYLYIQSTDGEVVVQSRQETWDQNPKVSVNRAGAMRVMEDRIEWYMLPSRALYVNGKLTDLPKSRLALPAGGAIEVLYAANKQTVMVYWPDDIFVGRMIAYSNNTMDVEVKKVYSSPRTYEGLIGNMDRSSKNDLQARGGDYLNGTTKDNIARVGESWRVRANETLFTRSHPAPTGASAKNQPAVTDLDANARASANQTCNAAGVTDATALRNCIYDVAATGDKTFVESARQFQETIAALPASERAAEKVEPMAVIVPPAAAAAASGVLFSSGSILERGSRHTMSGHHLIFQDDGNLCVYKSAGHQFVWCINNDPSVRYQTSAKAEVTADGRLLVTNAQGGVVWQAPTANARPGSEVFITENGTLQLRTASGQVTWSSR